MRKQARVHDAGPRRHAMTLPCSDEPASADPRPWTRANLRVHAHLSAPSRARASKGSSSAKPKLPAPGACTSSLLASLATIVSPYAQAPTCLSAAKELHAQSQTEVVAVLRLLRDKRARRKVFDRRRWCQSLRRWCQSLLRPSGVCAQLSKVLLRMVNPQHGKQWQSTRGKAASQLTSKEARSSRSPLSEGSDSITSSSLLRAQPW